MANPTNTKRERRFGDGRPQETLTGAALALLLLAAGLWFFSGASGRRGGRTAETRLALAAARWTGGPPESARQKAGAAIRLDLNVLSPARRPDENDLSRRAHALPDGRPPSLPSRRDDYLRTRLLPRPTLPTRAQFSALKQAVIARLNTADIRVLGDEQGAPAAAMGEPASVLVITRDLSETDEDAFLLVRARLQQTLYAPPAGSPVSATTAGDEAQYLGVRRRGGSGGAADTWHWTEKAVLYTVDQFLARRRFEARTGDEATARNADVLARYRGPGSGTPASASRK